MSDETKKNADLSIIKKMIANYIELSPDGKRIAEDVFKSIWLHRAVADGEWWKSDVTPEIPIPDTIFSHQEDAEGYTVGDPPSSQESPSASEPEKHAALVDDGVVYFTGGKKPSSQESPSEDDIRKITLAQLQEEIDRGKESSRDDESRES